MSNYINFPKKRIFGLLGAPRAGKDVVAKFLNETRNFEIKAFADKIKEEFGIDKEEFEAAKITGNVDVLRQKLWQFSANKKKEDPNYFITKVMFDTVNSSKSIVISDIRTLDELRALVNNNVNRIYFVSKGQRDGDFDTKGFLIESKIHKYDIDKYIDKGIVKYITNPLNGVYSFYKALDKFFFTEDIIDLLDTENKEDWETLIAKYSSQFDISYSK